MKIEKIVDKTKELIDEKDKAVELALESIGILLERYAKESCPVDTGLLRNSIVYCLDGEKPSKEAYKADSGGEGGKYDKEMPKEPEGKRAVIVGTNVEYASIVEMNEKAHHTVGQAHFIRDSLANHIGEYSKILAAEIKEVK